MTRHRSLRASTLAALLGVTLASTPAMALEPPVEVADFTGGPYAGHVTDLGHRGSALALTIELSLGAQRVVRLLRSTNDGLSWATDTIGPGTPHHLESQATVCAGHAVAAYAVPTSATTRYIRTHVHELTSTHEGTRPWTDAGDIARRPDVACVANAELAIAWFEKTSSGYKVVLEADVPEGDGATLERFPLGTGSPGRGLSVAATADRVYVAWFDGSKLKLRRFRIGTTSAHTLTSLGTTNLGIIQAGTTPKVGADGSKVVLAYTQGADLKVRRSTDRGVSFRSPRTIRDLPDASEVGALATTVTVKGDLVALGTIDIGGIDTLYGDGRGYKSTNGGSTFRRVTTHTGGRVLCGVVKVGSDYRWAEVWDQSLSGSSPGLVRFRRQ